MFAVETFTLKIREVVIATQSFRAHRNYAVPDRKSIMLSLENSFREIHMLI